MSLADLVRVGGDRVIEHANAGRLTTYRVGGSVRALVTLRTASDADELVPLIAATNLGMLVIGNGSNLLIADGEQALVAVRLEGDLSQFSWREVADGVDVVAGGGAALPVLARRLAADGVCGFEWAVGVPGSVGGAVVMNAGGHGSDVASSVTEVQTWHRDAWRTWTRYELDLSYRHSALGDGDLVLRATFRLSRGDASESQRRISEIVRWRRLHQPGGANAGSVFRNPVDDHAGRLIEAAGCKGLRWRSATVSDKHANFIIADAGGSAADVYGLIELVRSRVAAQTGVTLEPENRFIGFAEMA